MTLATVDLDGKLIGPWVDEVHTSVVALRREQAVCLNLKHLSFADAAGLRLLRALQLDGVPLLAASPLITGLLENHREQAERTFHAGESR